MPGKPRSRCIKDPRSRDKIGKAALVLGSSVLAVLLMEVAVRVLDIPPRPLAPLPVPSYRLSENPVIGYEFRPGYKPTEEPFDRSHKGYAINSAGFRDYEYEEEKPEGTYRIVVLGDSTTVGNGIPDLDKTYTKRLERLLNGDNHDGMHYEVLNLGVGGYHTLQEIETLRVKGLRYNPDLVLVTLCVNDFHPHSDGGVYKALRKRNPSIQNPGSSLRRFVLRRSRLAFIVYHRMRSRAAEYDESQKASYEQWYATKVLRGKTPVEAGLALLSELQQKHGFAAIVVILPEFHRPFSRYESVGIHKKVFQIVEEFPGITAIDLLGRFARVDNDARRFSYDGLHMNEYGHKVMAEILLPIVKPPASDTSRNARPGERSE